MLGFISEYSWAFALIAIIFAGRLGWKLHEIYFLWIVTEHPERVQRALDLSLKTKALKKGEFKEFIKEQKEIAEKEEEEGPAVQLAVEQIGDVFYGYAKHVGTFISQGSSLEEVIERAQKRFPNRRFIGEIVLVKSTN